MTGHHCRQDSACPEISVIIPFFQVEPGLLRNAIASITRQENVPEIEVIVVDDGSPLSAEAEIEGLTCGAHCSVRLHVQTNRGVAAARNTGLDLVSPSVRWIAFLDPDDAWGDLHLRTALAVLAQGYDFFFADSLRTGSDLTLFQAANFRAERQKPVAGQAGAFELAEDLLVTVLTYSPIITSTVVYRREGFQGLRFNERYRTYEDSYFWLHFRESRIAFVDTVQAILGEGVNISRTPDDWKSNHSLQILRDIDGLYRNIRENIPLQGPDRIFVRRLTQRNRNSIAVTIIAMLRQLRPVDLSVLQDVFGGRLALLVAVLAMAPRIVLRAVVSKIGQVLAHSGNVRADD